MFVRPRFNAPPLHIPRGVQQHRIVSGASHRTPRAGCLGSIVFCFDLDSQGPLGSQLPAHFTQAPCISHDGGKPSKLSSGVKLVPRSVPRPPQLVANFSDSGFCGMVCVLLDCCHTHNLAAFTSFDNVAASLRSGRWPVPWPVRCGRCCGQSRLGCGRVGVPLL